MPMDKGRKLTWKEACEILGCGKTCFYTLVRKGILPAYRLDGTNKGLWVYENDCRCLVKNIRHFQQG